MDKPVKEPKPTWVKEFRQAVLDNDIEVLELAGYLSCIDDIETMQVSEVNRYYKPLFKIAKSLSKYLGEMLVEVQETEESSEYIDFLGEDDRNQLFEHLWEMYVIIVHNLKGSTITEPYGEIKLRLQQYDKLVKLANKYGWDGELLPTLLHFIIDVNDLLGGVRREHTLKLIKLGKFLNED